MHLPVRRRARFAALTVGLACCSVMRLTAQGALVRQRFDVRIPMRDGVTLSADIWLPEAAGRYRSRQLWRAEWRREVSVYAARNEGRPELRNSGWNQSGSRGENLLHV